MFVCTVIPLLNVPAVETGVACSPTTLGSKVNLRSYPATFFPVVSPIVIGNVKLVCDVLTVSLESVTVIGATLHTFGGGVGVGVGVGVAATVKLALKPCSRPLGSR